MDVESSFFIQYGGCQALPTDFKLHDGTATIKLWPSGLLLEYPVKILQVDWKICVDWKKIAADIATSSRVDSRQPGMGSNFRHKHLYTFHKFWDVNGDGVLTWDDFRLLAEKYTKIQRRGKLDQDVYKRWESILGKWWDELTQHADFNKDTIVEFDEWLKFFHNLGQQTKTHKELPDFLQTYLQLFFFIMDSNKDGLFCVKDYKKYLSSHDMDVTRAKECFETMVNDEDRANGNAMTSDRFRELVYDFWVSQNQDSPGKYICGTFDSALLQELEDMNKKKSG